MANVAIEYNWGVSQKFRFESFCYGPKNSATKGIWGKKAPDYQGTVYLEAAPCFFTIMEGSGNQSR